jgi:hypothetical protein
MSEAGASVAVNVTSAPAAGALRFAVIMTLAGAWNPTAITVAAVEVPPALSVAVTATV